MRGRFTLILAAKYLYGHFRRYVFLLIALAFGFAVITTMTSLKEGMSSSVYRAAESHYAGHIFVLGFSKQGGGHIVVEKDVEIMRAVEEAGLDPQRIVRRTNYFGNGVLYFNGRAVRQKYVYGVDWDNERDQFLKLDYAAGRPKPLSESNGIIISEPVADRLGARMGDELILEVLTRTGQKNTGIFTVRGVVRDTSIFGYYKCFVDRKVLNGLLRYGEEEYSSLGLFFSSLDKIWEKNERLYNALQDRISIGPPIYTKEDLAFQMVSSWEGIRYLTFPLHVYVSQVAELLNALEIVSYFLYVLMALIILLSVLVTYQLIVRERSVEVATMRALGLRSGEMQSMLVLEMVLLFLLSIAIGWALSEVIIRIVSSFSYESIPGFDLFMTDGKLTAEHSPRKMAVNIAILVAILIPAVWIPANISSRSNLSRALAGGKT